MKPTLMNCSLRGLTIVFAIAFFMVVLGAEKLSFKFDMGVTHTAALFQVSNLLGHTNPVTNQSNELVLRANLIPTPNNNGYVSLRQITPFWGRTSLVKPNVMIMSFFFAIMVISLFFIFYQNSRTGSESDDIFLVT